MSEWRDVALGDVVTLINGDRGRNYPSAKHRSDRGIPFVNAGLLVEGRVRPGGDNFISQERFEMLRSGRVEVDDVLLCIRGSIGRLAIATADVVPSAVASSVVILRVGPAVNPSFLHSLLRSPKGQLRILEANNGAAQPNLGAGEVALFRFAIPSRATQDRIASVLDSIDDLIEINRRRVEVLEEMAKAIYREWFVHFRYPGHENVPLVDSSLGPIPESWEVRRLDQVASLVRGRSYRKHELVDVGGRLFVNLKCMMRGGGFRRDGLKRYDGKFAEAQLVGHGDVVLAVTDLTQGREILARATLVPRLPEPGVISLDVARIVPDEPADRLWLFAVLRWSDFADNVKEFANGSTVLHLSPDHVAAGNVLWPPGDLRASLVSALEPTLGLVDELLDGSDRLAALRDLLLPKLVTGQIDVSHLDLDELTEAATA